MENNIKIINKKKVNIDLLKQILSLQAESRKEKEQIHSDIFKLYNELFDEKFTKISNMDFYVDEHDNIYITKGKLNKNEYYNCIVSHSDQVCKYDVGKTVFQNGDYLFAQSGPERVDVGADDLTGVYACFQALIDFNKVKVVIFASEEIGCIGSSKVDLTFFSDCKFIAQFDRRGNKDFINHTNGVIVISDEFKTFVTPYIESYKYKFEHGTCTDVGELIKRDVGISSFNLSCGYYNAHSKNSYQSISELETAYNLFYDLCINSQSQFLYRLEKNKSIYGNIGNEDDIEYNIIKEVIGKLNKVKKQSANDIILKTIKTISESELYIDYVLEKYESQVNGNRKQIAIWQDSLDDRDITGNYNKPVKNFLEYDNSRCIDKSDCLNKHGFIQDFNDENELVKYCGLCYDTL